MGLRVLCVGQYVGQTGDWKDAKKEKVIGGYHDFAWFGGKQSVRLDHKQASILTPGKLYQLETNVREFKGDQSVGYDWRIVGEVDPKGVAGIAAGQPA